MVALDIVTGALQEINAVGIEGTPNNQDASFGLSKLNRLLDRWAARKLYIYDESFPEYTLVPGLNPHTIGPMGQIAQSSRAANVATYICPNNLQNGQSITVVNSTNGLSGSGVASAVSATQFNMGLAGADVAQAADTGQVVPTQPGATSGTPTFATPQMGQRPQKIEQATLVLTNSNPAVDIEINIRDSAWWMSQSVKQLETDVPTDLFYDPNWPNGSIYLWPVPNYAFGLRLKLWGIIPQLPGLQYQFSLPPGYQDAITMQLARDMVGAFQGSWTPQQEANYQLALKSVLANNNKSPRGVAGDVGMPGMGRQGGFNYYSGLPSRS